MFNPHFIFILFLLRVFDFRNLEFCLKTFAGTCQKSYCILVLQYFICSYKIDLDLDFIP